MYIILIRILFVGGIIILLFYVNSLNNNIFYILNDWKFIGIIITLFFVLLRYYNIIYSDISSVNFIIIDRWFIYILGWINILLVMFILNLLVGFFKTMNK